MQSILTTVLTLLGSLAGVWLGTRLARDNEARNWRRDRCLEAYTDVLRACDEVRFLAEAVRVIDLDDAARPAQSNLVLEKVAEMYRAADRAALLGPNEIQKHLGALVLYCGKQIGARGVASPGVSEDEWRNVIHNFATLFSHFRNDARSDLGVHSPLHTLEEWRKIDST
jgi:hypothetical protein